MFTCPIDPLPGGSLYILLASILFFVLFWMCLFLLFSVASKKKISRSFSFPHSFQEFFFYNAPFYFLQLFHDFVLFLSKRFSFLPGWLRTRAGELVRGKNACWLCPPLSSCDTLGIKSHGTTIEQGGLVRSVFVHSSSSCSVRCLVIIALFRKYLRQLNSR